MENQIKPLFYVALAKTAVLEPMLTRVFGKLFVRLDAQ